MPEARLWKLLRNSEAQPKFTLSYKKNYVYSDLLRCAQHIDCIGLSRVAARDEATKYSSAFM